MATPKNILAKPKQALISHRGESFWKAGALTVMLLSLAHGFLGEPWLFAHWRRSDRVGELRMKSEIEKRNLWGKTSWAEGRMELFVGDKVDADFTDGGVFKDAQGREQLLSYPFRVQMSSQKEILFSPLFRRTQGVSWVARTPTRILPHWNEILGTWASLKKEWAEFNVLYPAPTGTALSLKGKKRKLKRRAKLSGST